MKFSLWYQYFQSNRSHFDHLDWEKKELLNDKEKGIITSSIQQFQRGEYSEGKHFLQFAKSMKDESYIETVKIFIKEEQDHAAIIGKFMDIYAIKKLGSDWVDNTFRSLRKLAGLEGTVTVLLTAEIISMVYYKALKLATSSVLLQQICKQVLIDEEMHLRFQSFALGLLYKRKMKVTFFISKFLHNILMAGTIIVVWLYHKKVLRAGRYNFFLFFHEVWKEFLKCEKMIKDKESTLSVFKDVNYAA
jgi:hypothetical protein